MYHFYFPLLFLAIVAVNGRGYTGSFHTRGSEPLYTTNVNIGGVEVARLLSSRLRPANVRNAISGSDFDRHSYWVQSRLSEMHGLGSDEPGHYLSPTLGGPSDFWNLFPKSSRGNTNSDFKELERHLVAYLQYDCGDIQWDLSVQYEDPSRPRRPSTFKLDLVYYDQNGAQCHEETNSFANYPTYSPKGSIPYRSELSSLWSRGGGRSFERPYCPVCLHGRRVEVKGRPVPVSVPVPSLSMRSLSGYLAAPVPIKSPQSPITTFSSPYYAAENTVKVFAHSGFWGQNATLQPRPHECLNLDYDLYKKISSLMVTQGSCVTFYEDRDCQGHRFNQEAGVRDNLENFPDWRLRASHKTWNDMIVSVSSCSAVQPQTQIQPQITSYPAYPYTALHDISRPSTGQELTVDLYEHKEYRGVYSRVRASEGECTNIPTDFHHSVSSINSQGGCIMLWEFVGCRGSSRVEVVGRNPDLTQVRTQPGTYSRQWNDNVKAISLCNF